MRTIFLTLLYHIYLAVTSEEIGARTAHQRRAHFLCILFLQQNDEKTQKVIWVFHPKEDAHIIFIEDELNTAHVGIIIEIDEEFRFTM